MVLTCLALAACDPPPQPAGEVEDTGGADTNDPADPSAQWSAPLDPGGLILHMEASAERVVVVNTGVYPDTYTTVSAYTPSMELDWQLEFDEFTAGDFVALDDGSYLLSGAEGPIDAQDPSVLHLSCCGEFEPAFLNPQPGGESGSAFLVSPYADGYMLATTGFEGGISLVLVDAEFNFIWESAFYGYPYALVEGPTGDLVMLGDVGPGNLILWDVTDEGVGVGMSLSEPTALLGRGADLTLLASGLDQVVLRPWGEDDAVALAIPQLDFVMPEYTATRGNHVVVANAVTTDAGLVRLQVTEGNDAGDVLRRVFIDGTPGQQYLYATAAAVSDDDAIYVVTQEGVNAGPEVALLHRIPAL